jgi:hypothetical protein
MSAGATNSPQIPSERDVAAGEAQDRKNTRNWWLGLLVLFVGVLAVWSRSLSIDSYYARHSPETLDLATGRTYRRPANGKSFFVTREENERIGRWHVAGFCMFIVWLGAAHCFNYRHAGRRRIAAKNAPTGAP